MPKQLFQASDAGKVLKYGKRSGRTAALGALGLMLVVSACSPAGQAPTPTASGAIVTDLPASAASASPAATLAGTRTAEITELHNDVTSRASPEDEFESASLGYLFQVGGGVRTGEESRVRIDTSDGSIVRIASHTEFQLLELSP